MNKENEADTVIERYIANIKFFPITNFWDYCLYILHIRNNNYHTEKIFFFIIGMYIIYITVGTHNCLDDCHKSLWYLSIIDAIQQDIAFFERRLHVPSNKEE